MIIAFYFGRRTDTPRPVNAWRRLTTTEHEPEVIRTQLKFYSTPGKYIVFDDADVEYIRDHFSDKREFTKGELYVAAEIEPIHADSRLERTSPIIGAAIYCVPAEEETNDGEA